MLKLRKKNYYFYDSEKPFNNASCVAILASKFYANRLLEEAGLPVPRAYYLSKEEFEKEKLLHALAYLKFPMVIKPLRAAEGTDVLCNLQTEVEIENAVIKHFQTYEDVIIEEFHGNLESYRILMFKQRIIGVVHRHPASVVGDGKHSIRELAEQANIKRKKINPYIGPIEFNQETQIRLKELGITEDFIPRADERIVLHYTSNAARGGTFETCSLRMCKENRQLMKQISSILGLDYVGIDVQCKDLVTPIVKNNGVIIETNSRANVRIHELPMRGRPQWVTRKIMRSFIYQHPFAYIHSLYFNKRTSLYMRVGLSVLLFALIYTFLHGIKGII